MGTLIFSVFYFLGTQSVNDEPLLDGWSVPVDVTYSSYSLIEHPIDFSTLNKRYCHLICFLHLKNFQYCVSCESLCLNFSNYMFTINP